MLYASRSKRYFHATSPFIFFLFAHPRFSRGLSDDIVVFLLYALCSALRASFRRYSRSLSFCCLAHLLSLVVFPAQNRALFPCAILFLFYFPCFRPPLFLGVFPAQIVLLALCSMLRSARHVHALYFPFSFWLVSLTSFLSGFFRRRPRFWLYVPRSERCFIRSFHLFILFPFFCLLPFSAGGFPDVLVIFFFYAPRSAHYFQSILSFLSFLCFARLLSLGGFRCSLCSGMTCSSSFDAMPNRLVF